MNQPTLKRIEMKFRLDAELAEQVKDWARDHLGIDSNCVAATGDTYDINTLYLDTAELDLLHATGRIGRTKHRVRRYADEQTLWLETKRKKRMVVKKNRVAVHELDFSGERSTCPQDPWCGDWFLDRIQHKGLQPVVQIAYRRFARTSVISGQNVRLTIDDSMTASSSAGWKVPSTSHFVPHVEFGDCKVLELKFNGPTPPIFKDLLRTFTIPASGFSKYRDAMQALEQLSHPGSRSRQTLVNPPTNQTLASSATEAGILSYA